MASYLVQGNTTLYHVSQAGVAAAITLPSGLTLFGPSTPCRFVVFGSGAQPLIVVVNGGTHDVWIDWTGTARKLQISPPNGLPVLSAGTGTGLNGVYVAAVTFKVKDGNGATLMESGLSPASASSPTLANTSLKISNIPVSNDSAVNARGIYRSLAGGTALYPWFDLDDNTTLIDDHNAADSKLSILPTTAVNLGPAPDLKLCVSWKERLWGVPRNKQDSVVWTEDRLFYAWNPTNELIAPPKNADATGVSALIPRRDSLGIAKFSRFYYLTGTDNSSFRRIGLSETIGCVSQESVVVHQNVAYFLGNRGVVEWSDEGVRYVSNEQVRNWFTTDNYFNRTLFPKAKGRYNPDTDSYELSVALVGSTTDNYWVSFQLGTRTWMGPHKTDAFTPTAYGNGSDYQGILTDPNGLQLSVFGGSDGNIYKRDVTTINDNGTAVAMSLSLPVLSGNEPDRMKFWGQPTIHTRAEKQGWLTITPTTGTLDAAPDPPVVHDLRLARELLPRLGVGEFLQTTLTHSSTTERPRIFGVEIPYVYIGRR